MKQRLDDATLKEAGIKAEVDHLDGIVKQMKAEFDLQLMGGTMTKAAGPGLQIQRRIESMEDRLGATGAAVDKGAHHRATAQIQSQSHILHLVRLYTTV